MDQEQCAAADWSEVGRKDGTRGTKQSRYQSYVDDCAEFAIGVDTTAYREGWDEGIEDYCTRDNGFRTGVSGGHYDNVCPGNLHDQFFSAHQLGQSLADARREVEHVDSELDEVRDDLGRSNLTDEVRNTLLVERRQLKKQLDRAQGRLAAAESNASANGFPIY